MYHQNVGRARVVDCAVLLYYFVVVCRKEVITQPC